MRAGVDYLQKIFSSDDVHPRDRYDYWHDMACKKIIDHQSRPAQRLDFNAKLEAGEIDDLSILSLTCAELTVERTNKQIAGADNDDPLLCCQLSGNFGLSQSGTDVLIEAGSITLLDPRRPYSAWLSDDTKMMMLRLPRGEIAARVGDPSRYSLCALQGSYARMVSERLAAVARVSEEFHSETATLTRNHFLDLIAIGLSNDNDAGPRSSASRHGAVLALKAAIERRLSDPTLTVSDVAMAARISVRYANAILQEHETSLHRLIMERRLARCRDALLDARHDDRSISDIAYGWGFTDVSHFARRFRQAFGASPSEFRASHRDAGEKDAAR